MSKVFPSGCGSWGLRQVNHDICAAQACDALATDRAIKNLCIVLRAALVRLLVIVQSPKTTGESWWLLPGLVWRTTIFGMCSEIQSTSQPWTSHSIFSQRELQQPQTGRPKSCQWILITIASCIVAKCWGWAALQPWTELVESTADKNDSDLGALLLIYSVIAYYSRPSCVYFKLRIF